jgi:RNA polymerase sigma-70 factor (ECF subfamily)
MMGHEQLGSLLDQHASALILYARQWCAAPEDVVQEAFLKLVTQSPPPGNVVAWLYRVVRNNAISAARAEQRRRRHEGCAAEQTPTWFVPAEGMELDVEAATEALRELPLEQREVIVAYLWGVLSFEQIGEIAGTSASTAHRRYLAGLSALRERLKVSWPNRSPTRT